MLVLTCGRISYSQEITDSLKVVLDAADDSTKVEIYIKSGEDILRSNPQLALSYFEKAEEVARMQLDYLLIAKAKNKQGIAFYHLEDFPKSNQLYFEALNIYDSVDYKLGMSKELNNIAWNYRVQDMQEKSIEYFEQSLEIAEEIEDDKLLQGIYNNLGTAYRHTSKQTKALEYYHKSLAINQKIGNKQWEAFNLNNIGLANKDLGNYEEAKKYFFQARDINLELQNQEEYVNNLLNIGDVYIYLGSYDSAILYLNFALPVIESNEMERAKYAYYDYEVNLYETLGDYKKALDSHKKAVDIEKKLNKVEINEQISKLQAKYSDSEKSRKLIESVQKVNEQRLVIIGGTSFFLLLLGVLFLVLQLYKSKNMWARSVESLNDEINQKNEELQTVNEEIQSINDKLEVSVQERTRKIKTQNEKLVKYAFINSHEVRGPLARVLGLLYLLGLENRTLRNDESFKLLGDATKELDDVIGDASKLLEDEDLIVEKKEINK